VANVLKSAGAVLSAGGSGVTP